MSKWTLFSNHGHVLVCLAGDSDARLRDVAADVGITERAVQKIVRDLQQSGMVTITKHGRRNRYRIHGKENLRHDLESRCSVGGLMQFVKNAQESTQYIAVNSIETKPVRAKPAEPTIVEPAVVEPAVVRSPPIASQQATTPAVGKEELSTKSSRVKKVHEKPQGSLF